jgi:hypothetical protein
MSLKRLALLTPALTVAVLAPVPAVAATTALPPQCSGTAPIKCSFNVAPGNYDVTVELGSTTKAANTSMSVEARRQVLNAVSTTAARSSAPRRRSPGWSMVCASAAAFRCW